MRREEFRDYVEFLRSQNEISYDVYSGLIDGIDTLEQQPCEDKIIEWKKDFKEYVDSLSMLNDDYKGIMEYIDELPVTSQEPCEDIWIIDSLKEFLGESYGVLTSNKKEFTSWLERLRWHVIRCDELATELKNYKKQVECEDAISRDDALKALDYDIKSFEFKSGVGRHMDEIANLLNTIYEIQSVNIKALPPVQPKPKTGYWILLDECSNSGYYCSECRKKVVKEGWSGTVKKIKFCPNCGARMVEPQERNNE